MNKKLFALLVVGATVGQVRADAMGKFKGFFKATNALLNPIDLTGQKEETKKYAVASEKDDDGTNYRVVKQDKKPGYVDGNKDFKELLNFNTEDYVIVKSDKGTKYYVEKNGNNEPKIDNDNGVKVTTKQPSVEAQGWVKLANFHVAADADKKTSEAIWGFRQAVLGKRKASALITSAWGVLIGTFVIARSMAKDVDDEDDDADDDDDTTENDGN